MSFFRLALLFLDPVIIRLPPNYENADLSGLEHTMFFPAALKRNSLCYFNMQMSFLFVIDLLLIIEK